MPAAPTNEEAPATPASEEAPAAPGLDLRLVAPAAAAWSVLAWQLGAPAVRLVLTAGCCLVAAGLLVAIGRRATLALGCAACACTLLSGAAQSGVDHAGPVAGLAQERAVAQVRGSVLTEPRVIASHDERPDLVVLTMRLESVTARGQRTQVQTPVVVFTDRSWLDVTWRTTLVADGRFGTVDPGDAAVAAFVPRGPPKVDGEPAGPLRLADEARHRLRDSVQPLPEDARGLLPGLVIGDTSLTPADLRDDMVTTGMTHLSAVSGSNVAIVLGAVLLGCRAAGVPRRWRPVLAGLALAGFVVLCRPEPSVLRAAVMGVVGLVALSSSRRRASLPALGAAILVLLCLDPWLARSYGFALSCLATLGLVLFAGTWGEALAAHLPERARPLAYALAIPLAAQVACGPVLVLLQGTVNPIAVLANLLAAPLVAPTTLAGLGSALSGMVWAPLGVLAAWVGAGPAWLIGQIARRGALVPWGTVDWLDGAPGAWLLTVFSLVVLSWGPTLVAPLRRVLSGRPRRAALGVVAAGACLVAWCWPTPGADGWPPPGWTVVGCDVGQGDAFVVRSGPARAVLIDTGPDPALVTACLDRLGVEQLDALVLTHFHADHVDGLDGVIGHLPVAAAYLTPIREPPAQARRVLAALADAQVPTYEVRAGDRLGWGPVRASVLWPARRIGAGSVPNNASVVLDLTVDGTRILFAGDIEPEAARAVRGRLEASAAGADVDVLKVAHHGSAAQDDLLVRELDPEVAMIGVGQDNDFGHPTPSALRLLAQTGAVVLRTDTDGDVAVGRLPDGTLFTAHR